MLRAAASCCDSGTITHGSPLSSIDDALIGDHTIIGDAVTVAMTKIQYQTLKETKSKISGMRGTVVW
jgi:hypothetical protein